MSSSDHQGQAPVRRRRVPVRAWGDALGGPWQRALTGRLRWLPVVLVVAPLAVLLALQYRWLVQLESNQAAAVNREIDRYLDAMAAEVERHYRGEAERTARLPEWVLDSEASPFGVAPFDSARWAFLIDLRATRNEGDETEAGLDLRLFEPRWNRRVEPVPARIRSAIEIAAAPWVLMARQGGAPLTSGLIVDERDPERRLLAHPILGEADRVVGLAGLVIDESVFLHRVLPRVAAETKPAGCPLGPSALAVRDRSGRAVLPSSDSRPWDDALAARSFGLVFTDYTFGMIGDVVTPESWARTAFLVNVTVAAILALLLVLGSVSLVRLASRERALSRMKSEFVSNVSHQLRTPLSSIRAFGELLSRSSFDDPERVHVYGERIERESRRLTHLIERLLDFAKLESGGRVWSFGAVDLGRLIRDEVGSLDDSARARIVIGSGVDSPAAGTPIVADEAAVRQALRNLLDNALRYSRAPDPVLVDVVASERERTIVVEDRGVGIPRAECERVFERFHRVARRNAPGEVGTGLGLAIVREIASVHGGTVELDSRPGRGCTFRFRLPIGGPPAGSVEGGPPEDLAVAGRVRGVALPASGVPATPIVRDGSWRSRDDGAGEVLP